MKKCISEIQDSRKAMIADYEHVSKVEVIKDLSYFIVNVLANKMACDNMKEVLNY